MIDNKLESICILGLGLLGGSLGLAVNRVWPHVRRLGYSHRAVTRQAALEASAVDAVFESPGQAAGQADMVVLASPIGTFQELLERIAANLRPGTLVTDVGSTKRSVCQWAQKTLPKTVTFIGSHPMAGSEQRGVEFARADLFEDAACIVTPLSARQKKPADFLCDFWKQLGMRVSKMTPQQHDKVLGRISHLPHVLASALVNMSKLDELMLCGKGFLDTSRIASGPESVWHDILMTNADNSCAAIEHYIAVLRKFQHALARQQGTKVTHLLKQARLKRNELLEKKLIRKELPS